MESRLSTQFLQSLVSKAMKGASQNKMIPLTSLMSVDIKGGIVTLTTTDSTNYLQVNQSIASGDDMSVVVPVELFSKLISKLTCDYTTFIFDGTSLTIKGNGTYLIELPLDEDGSLVSYPNPVPDNFISTETIEIDSSTADLLSTVAKASVSDSLDIRCYTGYYIADKVVTTDTYKMCGINKKICDVPILVNQSTINLLSVFGDSIITIKKNDTDIIFDSDDCTVYGKLMDCISDFQIGVISSLLDDTYDSSCKINRLQLLQLLDRLMLFVSIYDKNSIYLSFESESIKICSKQSNSVETVPYIESNNFMPYSCSINIEMLYSQIKANMSNTVEIHYGKSNAIKITDGDVTQVIALMTD